MIHVSVIKRVYQQYSEQFAALFLCTHLLTRQTSSATQGPLSPRTRPGPGSDTPLLASQPEPSVGTETLLSRDHIIYLSTCHRRLLLRLVEDAGRPPPLEYPGLVLVYCNVVYCTVLYCTVPGECGGWAQRGTSAAHSSGSSATLELGGCEAY